MTRQTYGNQTLPSDANVSKGFDQETHDMLTAIQNLSKAVRYGAGAPTAVTTEPSIYIRSDGTSVTSFYLNPTGATWTAIALTATP